MESNYFPCNSLNLPKTGKRFLGWNQGYGGGLDSLKNPRPNNLMLLSLNQMADMVTEMKEHAHSLNSYNYCKIE